jgi:hypothetical protein
MVTWIDILAMRALPGYYVGFRILFFWLYKPVHARNFVIDVYTGQVGIGLKHRCIYRAPHHSGTLIGSLFLTMIRCRVPQLMSDLLTEFMSAFDKFTVLVEINFVVID